VSALQALLGWLDPTTDVVAEKEVRGDITPEEYRKLNVEAMNDSKSTAELLALERLGFTDLTAGALVDSVAPKSPAEAVLRANDVIVEVDGSPVKTTEDAVAAIRAHQPGDVVRMQVVRGDGPPAGVEATLAGAEDGRPLLGVRLRPKVKLPFEISIDSGDVVGPSAGLAYALELLDLLTAGELTGGAKVAATGELAPNGQVGPVGGMRQKVITVKRAGATVLLVPKANEADARAHAGDGLQIFGVATFDDALQALGSIQGSNAFALALARPSPGS
jgi:PDZ domain-containing protein